MSFEMGLFETAAKASFKNAHPNLPVSHDELWDEVVNAFQVNDLNPDGAVGEIQRFMKWIKEWKLQISMPQVDRLSVGIQMKAGDGWINMQLHAQFGLDFADNGMTETKATQRSINLASNVMLNQLLEAYDYLRANGQAPAPAAAPASAPASAAGDELVLGEMLVVEFKDDKLTYKIKGGKYSQYGAAVYPEVLTAAGFDVKNLGMGSHVLNRNIHVVKNDRGFAKVIKID
jgi:hypothetical protein